MRRDKIAQNFVLKKMDGVMELVGGWGLARNVLDMGKGLFELSGVMNSAK